MRFKTYPLSQEQTHSSVVSCVAWISNDEIYSCGDDHVLLRWNSSGKNVTKVAELPQDIFPTSMHCLPRPTSSKKSGSDQMLFITCADGKILLLSASGRVEKTLEAHKAAILCSQLSRDGSSLLTGAEDGSVKVWSRSAMLRSTVSTNSVTPVFTCDWSPDSQTVAYAQRGNIILKPLSPSLNAAKWQAHDGIIMSIAWSPISPGTIVSGAEDCRYKVWDAEGRLLFSSTNQGAPVTGLAWSWNAQLLAVGAHDSLRLCHSSGWSYSAERVTCGGVHGMAWSKDNSQVVVACGSGNVLVAYVIDREVQAGGVQAHMVSQRVVHVRDLESSDQWETLETKSSVLQLVAGHGHVAVATNNQCLVYNVNSINTPAEIKMPGVFLMQITSKSILAVNDSGFGVFTLEGRPVALPRLPNLPPQSLTESTISLSLDTLAIRDNVDLRVVHLLEVGSLRGGETQDIPRIRHSEAIRTVALSQTEQDRCLAMVDVRGDLHVAPNPSAVAAKTYKLASMVRCMMWNTSNPYLAAFTESQLIVWFYPQTVAIDRSLLINTTMERELSELGSGATIAQFFGSLLEVKRQDQVSVHIPFCPAPAALYLLTEKGQFDKALTLLRRVSPTSGMKPGCMHSLYAVRCRAKMQPQRALVSYVALGCVETVEMLLLQE